MEHMVALFDLRWLTIKYFKSKGFNLQGVTKCYLIKNKVIKKVLKNTNGLFLSDRNEKPYAILVIKDWKRVVGVDQCRQMDRLRTRLNEVNEECNDLEFILVSNQGFSESAKSYARRFDIKLISASVMEYEYPRLGELRRLQRKKSQEVQTMNKESVEVDQDYRIMTTEDPISEFPDDTVN